MRKPERKPADRAVRCAIYTRKSSDEGLEQEFNSLDAQREACEAYIVSQKHAGWIATPEMYDDGGLSGGTMERPALLRLLVDIRAGKIQTIVVYKVDRLTRSLADFAKIVDVLDAHNASFVSVTQSFNTTTSMGRLTLNMLLSFAQFEREIAGERIRDKIAASKAKGMWMGGSVPLGYDVCDRKLIINETEADIVRMIFQRYDELRSVSLLRLELRSRGIVSKQRPDKSGRCAGGKSLSRGALYLMLQNRLYRGDVSHKGNVYRGQHDAIVDLELWQTVQQRLAVNRQERLLGVGAEAPSLLAGLIVDASGNRMTPTHANKRGKRYRYYISASLLSGDNSLGRGAMRIPAGEIEGLVLDRLRRFLGSRFEVAAAIAPLAIGAVALENTLGRCSELAKRWTTMPPVECKKFLQQFLEQVSVTPNRIDLHISVVKLLEVAGLAAEPVETGSTASIVLAIEASFRRAGKGRRIVIEGDGRQEINAGLVKLLRQAFAAQSLLLVDSDESINDITARLGKSKGHMTSLMRLSYLSPRIVNDVLSGRQPIELSAKRLLRVSKDVPLDWDEQRAFLGFTG
ncbi:MAG: recombinase family protein [Hyphomicrobium sp.]